ncbi:MAG: LysR family transcriptional regulator [Bryobacterales bacterium]|nr:LysR family transcriptional regulator [Bryobacterales bacterium]MDE0296685.1 LysR family transcriptional regulator [Bryobacterales bacterium]
MDLQLLGAFKAVVEEGSFSAAGQRLRRTQPAVSIALKRLETELGEKLIDRSSKSVVLTDAGKAVYEYSKRFDDLKKELRNRLVELRDKSTGSLSIGANESTALYLLRHVEEYRTLYPGVKVEMRRSLSSRIPASIAAGSLDLGVISYDPEDPKLVTRVIYNDSLVFIVSPRHRFAGRKQVRITELGMESFIAHNVISPYRKNVVDAFRRHGVPLNMNLELPTIETIRRMVQANLGVTFMPKMCVERELASGSLVSVPVDEVGMERKINLVHAAKRQLSHAARAFLELVEQRDAEAGRAVAP